MSRDMSNPHPFKTTLQALAAVTGLEMAANG